MNCRIRQLTSDGRGHDALRDCFGIPCDCIGDFMKLIMCSVYDSKVEAFDQPRFFRSRGEALRSWQTVVNDPSAPMCMHPSDFSFFELGEFDISSGTFSLLPTPKSLGLAIEFKKESAQQDSLPFRSVKNN